ncbi:hypothetical protein [Shigella phage CT02]|uniref:Host specificity protein B n=1 Tax=Shigella phage CT02 TaxID=3003584 RepID=A0A9E9ESY8_9CAUD|nr:hypothetical protein [Shigella phage CT02]
MGFFKKIKKAVKKVVKEVGKPIEKAGKEVGKAVGGTLGAGKQEIIQQEAPAPVVAAPPPAQVVDVPEQDKAEGEAQTESARKKARSGGKKALSVARSSGGGINI